MRSAEHLFKPFDSDLESLRAKLLQMGGVVEGQVLAAVEAFSSDNEEEAARVVETERQVNAMELELDDGCAHVIARHQPAAGDLRFILAVAKAVTDLERIGDEADKIARMTRQLLSRGVRRLEPGSGIPRAGALAAGMLRRALDAFARGDAEAAAQIIRDDRTLDDEFRMLLRGLITFMMEDPRTISSALDLLWIGKAIERIGDHAKNLAEHVIYAVEGTDVRHAAAEGGGRA